MEGGEVFGRREVICFDQWRKSKKDFREGDVKSIYSHFLTSGKVTEGWLPRHTYSMRRLLLQKTDTEDSTISKGNTLKSTYVTRTDRRRQAITGLRQKQAHLSGMRKGQLLKASVEVQTPRSGQT